MTGKNYTHPAVKDTKEDLTSCSTATATKCPLNAFADCRRECGWRIFSPITNDDLGCGMAFVNDIADNIASIADSLAAIAAHK